MRIRRKEKDKIRSRKQARVEKRVSHKTIFLKTGTTDVLNSIAVFQATQGGFKSIRGESPTWLSQGDRELQWNKMTSKLSKINIVKIVACKLLTFQCIS